MTVRFGNYRLFGYVFMFLLSGTVLGLSANFAKIFLPTLHHDFTIMALVASSLTIFVFLLLIQWSQPKIEVPVLAALGILWIAVAAFASDQIGSTECYSLGNQRTAARVGDTSARAYCYEMKVIEAFSWAIFILMLIYFVIVIALTSKAKSMGNYHAWSEPITNLPWFGDQGWGQQPQYGYGGQQMYYPPGTVQQQMGHSVIIQPGHHGQPTTVQQVPTM